MAKNILLVILCTFSICYAYEQFFTLYSELNFRGNSITFRSKQPDISNFTHFILNSKSIQARGYWVLFGDIQYTGASTGFANNDILQSINYTPSNGVSIRHGGVLETSQPSISFYSSTRLTGLEKIITAAASNDITFTPASIFSTGFSNWTFFTGSDFDGNATCYISTTENHDVGGLNSTLSNIRSLIRGCLGRIDTYLFAKDFHEPQNPSEDFLSNEYQL